MKYLFCLLLLCFSSCLSTETTSDDVVKTSNSKDLEAPATEVHQPVVPEVRVYGAFANAKGDGEHASGYIVRIWTQGEAVFGLISGSGDLGLAGDTPIGIFDQIRFDTKSRKLKFRSKLSVGKRTDGSWSRDVYLFSGVLKDNELKGDLVAIDELCPDKCVKKSEVVLRKSKTLTGVMDGYRTYEEWRIQVKKMLKRRGPKW